jgi:hypothetical protein
LTNEGDAVVSVDAVDECIAPYQIIPEADRVGSEGECFEAGFDGDLGFEGTGNWEQGTDQKKKGKRVEGRGLRRSMANHLKGSDVG